MRLVASSIMAIMYKGPGSSPSHSWTDVSIWTNWPGLGLRSLDCRCLIVLGSLGTQMSALIIIRRTVSARISGKP